MKLSASGTVVSAACCFGLLNVILGLFGLTAAIAYVNTYGDYIFFPAFAIFGAIFMKQLLNWKKNWLTLLLSLAIVGVMIWFITFGILYTTLIIGGVIIGLILIKLFRR